jgi:ribosomal silencing factor RsfS
MDGIDFFEWIPNVAIGLLAFIIVLAVWIIWRNIAPAAPGISLGYYEIVGRYAGQKIIKRIKGTLVDATALFLNPQIENAFLEILKEDVNEIEARTKEKMDDVKKALENANLSNTCRIIVTREKMFTKHVLIQYGYVDKPLNAYAAYDPQAKFTLGFGFLTQGVITGEIHTLPQPWQIYKLGKVHVHLFKPDTLKNESEENPPEHLAKLALYAPATVELTQIIKAKDEQLKEKQRELLKAGKEKSAQATLVDGLLTAIQAFTTKLKPEEGVIGKGFDLMDFVTLALPTLLGYLIAENMGTNPLVGVFFGLFLGAYIIFRKR